jgi:hypothetical protein
LECGASSPLLIFECGDSSPLLPLALNSTHGITVESNTAKAATSRRTPNHLPAARARSCEFTLNAVIAALRQVMPSREHLLLRLSTR